MDDLFDVDLVDGARTQFLIIVRERHAEEITRALLHFLVNCGCDRA